MIKSVNIDSSIGKLQITKPTKDEYLITIMNPYTRIYINRNDLEKALLLANQEEPLKVNKDEQKKDN